MVVPYNGATGQLSDAAEKLSHKASNMTYTSNGFVSVLDAQSVIRLTTSPPGPQNSGGLFSSLEETQ